jgi:hypothetical protein
MNVTRNVILDLLPLYVAGEASPDTRALVEEYLQGDPELALEAQSSRLENLAEGAPASPTPDKDSELALLRRTRGLLGWQRRLYAWALTFSILCLSSVFYIQHGHVRFHLLLSEYPKALWGCASLAVTFWINYFLIRRRVRTTSKL